VLFIHQIKSDIMERKLEGLIKLYRESNARMDASFLEISEELQKTESIAKPTPEE
jgi:hypothetical protein